MDPRGFLLMLLLLLMILSHDHNRLLALFKKKHYWSCPQLKMKCLYKEFPDCLSDKNCKIHEKCCHLSCGMRCLGIDDNPCEEIPTVKPCAQSITRWYFNITKNRCLPIEFNQCSRSKNNFQTREVCRRTCLEFGHGTPIKLFELEGEPFTVLI
ncbi:eppin-like [Sarcophilus harrisii]|uniref:eppin-like n=1 Tax=Sarcophilus harrisii TaxID=9305 RepID=UPI000C7A0D4B|nr:eppin-like [Sarcophilus harrisii]